MKFAVLFASAFMLFAGAAQAHEYKIGTLDIGHPWTRATPKGATVAGAYLKITNKGQAADRLTAVSSEAAGRVEIHEMAMAGGTMKMRPLKAGIEIKPGETVEFKPGSYHIMMMDLKQPFEQGKRVKGTLTFEKAGTVDVEFAVDALGAQTPTMGGHSMQGH